MPEAVNDLETPFILRELTGQKRTLTLRDRAKPYRPFTLEGEQRNAVEWYPGSPIGTLQVFGAKEGQSTVTGMWKDIFLGGHDRGSAPAQLETQTSQAGTVGISSTELVTVIDLVKVVDGMRRSGQEIEVSWLGKIRRGILEKFTEKWHTGHDVEWEIMFTWTSQAESADDVQVVDDTATGIGDTPNQVQAQLDSILAAASDLIQDASDRSADFLQEFTDASGVVAGMTDDLTDAVVNVGYSLTSPNEALLRIAGILDGIKLSADDLSSSIQDRADGIILDSGALTDVGDFARPFGVILGIRADARDRSAACDALRALCASRQSVLLQRTTSSTIQSFQARDGQDLRQVSQQFYGTPDEWRGLMVYNNLASSELRAGQVVFVPAQAPDGNC